MPFMSLCMCAQNVCKKCAEYICNSKETNYKIVSNEKLLTCFKCKMCFNTFVYNSQLALATTKAIHTLITSSTYSPASPPKKAHVCCGTNDAKNYIALPCTCSVCVDCFDGIELDQVRQIPSTDVGDDDDDDNRDFKIDLKVNVFCPMCDEQIYALWFNRSLNEPIDYQSFFKKLKQCAADDDVNNRLIEECVNLLKSNKKSVKRFDQSEIDWFENYFTRYFLKLFSQAQILSRREQVYLANVNLSKCSSNDECRLTFWTNLTNLFKTFLPAYLDAFDQNNNHNNKSSNSNGLGYVDLSKYSIVFDRNFKHIPPLKFLMCMGLSSDSSTTFRKYFSFTRIGKSSFLKIKQNNYTFIIPERSFVKTRQYVVPNKTFITDIMPFIEEHYIRYQQPENYEDTLSHLANNTHQNTAAADDDNENDDEDVYTTEDEYDETSKLQYFTSDKLSCPKILAGLNVDNVGSQVYFIIYNMKTSNKNTLNVFMNNSNLVLNQLNNSKLVTLHDNEVYLKLFLNKYKINFI